MTAVTSTRQLKPPTPLLLIHLDRHLWEALNRVAPANGRTRINFIQQAIRTAIRTREYEIIREAYRQQADRGDADDWRDAEDWKP